MTEGSSSMNSPLAEHESPEKALWYQEVLSLDPASRIFLPYARLLAESGRRMEAIEVLRAGLSRHPEFLDARLLLIEELHAAGQDAAAGLEAAGVIESLSQCSALWDIWSRLPGVRPDQAAMLRFFGATFKKDGPTLADVFEAGMKALGAGASTLAETNARPTESEEAPSASAPNLPDSSAQAFASAASACACAPTDAAAVCAASSAATGPASVAESLLTRACEARSAAANAAPAAEPAFEETPAQATASLTSAAAANDALREAPNAEQAPSTSGSSSTTADASAPSKAPETAEAPASADAPSSGRCFVMDESSPWFSLDAVPDDDDIYGDEDDEAGDAAPSISAPGVADLFFPDKPAAAQADRIPTPRPQAVIEGKSSLCTRSMARILEEQGATGEAANIYRELLEVSSSPEERAELNAKLDSLMQGAEPPAPEQPADSGLLNMLETLAARLENKSRA